jgi:hypothetical protein
MNARDSHETFLNMKRILLSALLSVLPSTLALATTNYINNSTVSILAPPQFAPQIDASNFVNNGIFYITNLYNTALVQPPMPYQSWNTRNWTNANRMAGDSGFRFDYYDSVGQSNGWSANFRNAGNVNPTNANIFGAWYTLVSATNIDNKGTMTVGGPGLMTLNGRALDLTRGTFGVVGNETNNLAGVRDLYWGVGDSLLGGFFTANAVASSPMLVTTIEFPQFGPPFYAPMFQSLQFSPACSATPCTNGFTTYVTSRQVVQNGDIYTAYDVLFLRQTNAAISTDVRFSAFGSPGATKMIGWSALITNRVNGAVTTNRLYLTDTFGSWYVTNTLVQTPQPIFIYTLFAAARYRPINYSITHAPPPGFSSLTSLLPTVLNPAIFSGTNTPTYSTNTGWAATITGAPFPLDPTISGATWSSVPGRIELTASTPGSYLDLTRAKISGQSYMRLTATNHFVGCTNAVISSPVSDFELATTNGSMAISNLVAPFVPAMEGEIQVWSGRWTNVTAAGFGTLYSVTFVDSALVPQAPSQVQNLSIRSPNLVISDTLNIFGSLFLDTLRLTITTNAGNAPTPYGELNLTSGDLLWSPSLPRLQTLTNFGRIATLNSIYFAGARTPPWFTGTFDEPYLSFVNHGLLSSVGNSTWANYYEFSGTNSAGIGPISVQANTAIMTNGIFLANDQDISITAGSLLISNQVLEAGRAITLTITNYLDDGSLSNRVGPFTSQNTWTVGGGINLPHLPPQASLLGTTVTNTAYLNAEVENIWAGADYGCRPGGFDNNAALGRLILDGQDAGSLFTFHRTGASNALYVDLIEFKDATTNLASGSLPGTLNAMGINLEPNFNIYYGQAIINGHSIAEKLNGGHGLYDTNGGSFFWVSNYNTGFYSSTNITYTDGSVHRLNTALVYSCDINSSGQPYPPTGGMNATCDGTILKPDPIPVLTPSTLVLTATYTNQPVRAAVLSWNTIPLSSNYLYTSTSLFTPSASWVLVTNFLSSDAISGRATVIDPIKPGGPHYYRVRALSP